MGRTEHTKAVFYKTLTILSILLYIAIGACLHSIWIHIMYDKDYTIGDVIELTDANEPIMIIGYCQEHSVTGEVYDYVGVSYPDGYLGSDYNYLFNEEDVIQKYKDYDKRVLIDRKDEIQGWATADADTDTENASENQDDIQE